MQCSDTLRPFIWPVPQPMPPETQIYLYNSPVWGQFSAPYAPSSAENGQVESIVNRTTALWSIWIMASLILRSRFWILYA